ncbi:hypothetical protein HaLaN_26617 [Haematococcus lacustris]|uniref:Uncharacterized protein n=1 Tax=Haematococcus lacustris TaxID=44745 RepID=A0A6A0A6P5_HAELA|nr:hypothetical protein HaLaN_26617 [Haematococcus lacustris]
MVSGRRPTWALITCGSGRPASPQTDPLPQTKPAEAVVSASWWSKLKAAPGDAYKKCKEFCTNGKLKELAYDSLDVLITLLDTVGPLLPPPGKQ